MWVLKSHFNLGSGTYNKQPNQKVKNLTVYSYKKEEHSISASERKSVFVLASKKFCM